MVLNATFWKNKSVFITGHTGFKGSWMALCLSSMGAKVSGYSLAPPTDPSLFEVAKVENFLFHSEIADIRDIEKLKSSIGTQKPEIIIHMAAQPLVRDSYKDPIETYSTNVMGTANILEAIRLKGDSVRVFLNITTDKVYENKEWVWPYRENERLGGLDPYSNSKACSELVTHSYENSFFKKEDISKHRLSIATARAGNVIGGGDFANDRLIPDLIRSISLNQSLKIRNPNSIRPWQHVLEPINGYLLLIESMYDSDGIYNGAWNFGPNTNETVPVIEIVHKLQKIIEVCQNSDPSFQLNIPRYEIDNGDHPHEANFLKLDISKAKNQLNWFPKWNIDHALLKILEWTNAYLNGTDIQNICLNQIEEYSRLTTV
ncbi:CDP-glucose 4,6-dehydratase [Leptospira jelokensis]|uniref:CDP-glucose 4,6-dehydratase n=1 Tax=Leptospira jelokensis TaxID=2484931 RepID=UPI001090BA5C|nr:CDP-glucose 4,6-dehydratase [Leptospira jelokensis]TGL99807.1 CDP-glucose 4,6-dehydratase [Leptospira jelokensis]